MSLDPRHPIRLDARGQVLLVAAGHVDVFAVDRAPGMSAGRRSHLLRIAAGEVVLDLHNACGESSGSPEIVMIGGGGAELEITPREQIASSDGVLRWINHLAVLIAAPSDAAAFAELTPGETCTMRPGERRRGPPRDIAWVSVAAGSIRLMRSEPIVRSGDPLIPLTAGLWIEAGEAGCEVRADADVPDASALWSAVDRFHLAVVSSIAGRLSDANATDEQRLARRAELESQQTVGAFERLAQTVLGTSVHVEPGLVRPDPLLSSCRAVAATLGVPVAQLDRPASSGHAIGDVLEIARRARLRVRRVRLRDGWWRADVGPLIAWSAQDGQPVAVVRGSRSGYTMIDPNEARRRPVDRLLAKGLAPQAVTLYPTLPSRPLRWTDLAGVSAVGLSGSIARIALAVLGGGLLSLVQPLVTNLLVNSAIPRTEIDQLLACALALVVTALSIAGLQVVQGMAMLRLEGLAEYRLQAALIDRLLRLPASLFRDYTAGDLVDRSMGIDAVRKTLTVHNLRGLTALLFCLFSIALMLYYDVKLGSIAVLLVAVRAAVIMAAGGLRIYYEARYLDLQGKIGGFVIQLITGVGKLRVARATGRALALWSERFSVQKRYFTASQKVSNALSAFESSYPTLATLVIFAIAFHDNSEILRDLGAFLGFLAAFGQTLASVGNWASSISEALVAVPQLARLKPLMSTAAEIGEERRPPGALSGEIELSGVGFRYAQGGPPVLDDVTLKIQRGEYVAIVGPSGSGKSSLLRLLLGFEQPETGSVFYDGKALNTLDISAVRRQLGVVLQDTKLATGSLYENICGGIDLSQDKAWEAARQAGLDTDIQQMPMGMHTLVSEGFNTLSGGQRQRVMIARALARAPRILLFDEATSALDNRTQAIVAASLERLPITRLVIAHRLSTVRQADRIIMLSGGKVVQVGSYAELVARPGPFADFAARQLL